MKHLILIFCLLFLTAMSAQENSTYKVKSKYNFNKTVELLITNLKEKNIPVFTIIDHAKNAKDVNLHLNPSKVIIFGSPKIGTLLMQENINIALELPLKISINETDNDEVWISYLNMSTIAKKYKLTQNPIIPKIKKLLKKITESVKE